ncbi:hypothetical protein A3Q56_02978 [Intoshia linei]|uniref:LisH domain-containing protein n=1 Tax=Intoshia linei TaxID=1819745 RepID=A0A177B4W1_9BILA|nr:hypothetical protein A3Q56_02978 [Intoshia linei]
MSQHDDDEDSLDNLVFSYLNKNGKLNELKKNLRYDIFNAIENPDNKYDTESNDTIQNRDIRIHNVSNGQLLVGLVNDFLISMKFCSTHCLYKTDVQYNLGPKREEIKRQLNIDEGNYQDLYSEPLLAAIVDKYLKLTCNENAFDKENFNTRLSISRADQFLKKYFNGVESTNNINTDMNFRQTLQAMHYYKKGAENLDYINFDDAFNLFSKKFPSISEYDLREIMNHDMEGCETSLDLILEKKLNFKCYLKIYQSLVTIYQKRRLTLTYATNERDLNSMLDSLNMTKTETTNTYNNIKRRSQLYEEKIGKVFLLKNMNIDKENNITSDEYSNKLSNNQFDTLTSRRKFNNIDNILDKELKSIEYTNYTDSETEISENDMEEFSGQNSDLDSNVVYSEIPDS